MKGIPTNNKAMQERIKRETMAKYGNDKKVKVISNNVKKMVGDKARIKAELAMKPSKKGSLLS